MSAPLKTPAWEASSSPALCLIRPCSLGKSVEDANTFCLIIDLIHDTHHLCTHIRTDGLKAVSRGFSGGKQDK